MSFFLDISSSFILGLLAPLTATCILPLYPGFISFLSNQKEGSKNKSLILGVFVSIGLILFMLLLGLLFTTLFQISLTKIISIVSPIAFGLLAIFSILMIFNIDLIKNVRTINAPTSKNPKLAALLYGLFFGAIIIPCNPGIIAIFFSRAVSTTGFLGNMVSFLAFSIGMALPLLILAGLTQSFSSQILKFLTKNKRWINLVAGLIMLIISLYYLIFNFKVFG